MANWDLSNLKLLVSQQLPLNDFYSNFLGDICKIAKVSSGVVWNCSTFPYQEICRQPIPHATNNAPPMSQIAHHELLGKATKLNQSVIARPSNLDDLGEMPIPLVLLAPIRRKPDRIEILELIINVEKGKALPREKELTNFVDEACKLASKYALPSNGNSHDQQSPGWQNETRVPNPSFATERADNFLFGISDSINQRATCSNIANESRRLLDCDRVSVAVRKHGKYRLEAISGQTSVNRRSNTTKCLELLMRKILKTGQTFWYPSSEIPPQLEKVLEEYLLLSATRSVVIEPVFEKTNSLVVEDPESNERPNKRVIGGIVFEHCREQWIKSDFESPINFVSRHAGNALRNSHQHQNLFLYPLWNILGKSRFLAGPRALTKTVLTCSCAVLACIFLAIWPTDFYVVCEGVILPQKIQRVYSQTEGVVHQLDVSHGDTVAEGKILCRLKNEDLEFKQQEIDGRILNMNKRLDSIRDERFASRFDDSDQNNNEENINSIEAQIESLERQREILNAKAKKLLIRSPLHGQVITWDLQKRLMDRPVQNGDMLMEVAETEGKWILELNLEDRRIGHLLNALDTTDEGTLPLTFLMAADPKKRLKGRVIGVGKAAEINSDKKKTLKLYVEIDENELPAKHARSGVTAKVVCGRSSLGYLWLHDVGEFLQKHVLFHFAN